MNMIKIKCYNSYEDTRWDSLEGVLKHVKKSSVELQHEAWDGIVEKHSKRLKVKS